MPPLVCSVCCAPLDRWEVVFAAIIGYETSGYFCSACRAKHDPDPHDGAAL